MSFYKARQANPRERAAESLLRPIRNDTPLIIVTLFHARFERVSIVYRSSLGGGWKTADLLKVFLCRAARVISSPQFEVGRTQDAN